ncbi:MAG: MFS transporter [Candidatus Lokiarchaeota archaeon]|nr:MFS transporter [Candidatus Lokiarchaeota archaeon]
MEMEEQQASKTTFQNYLLLWIGQNFSYLGSAIVAFIIILQLAGGANSVLSIAAILSFAPSILFGAIAGVFADRLNKKIIIIITDSLQALATLVLIILYYTVIVQIWQIYVILAFRGICQAFHGPVVSALTPLMVPKEKLSRMNGIGYLLSSFIGIVGPVVGVSILLVLDVREALWIDIISYILAMIPLFFVRIPKVNHTEESKKNSFFMDLKEGFSILGTIPGLISLMTLAMIINMLLQPIDVLFPNYILVEFGKSQQILGFVSASFPLGILVGSLITSIKKKWKHKSKWIFVGLNVVYVCYGLMVLPKLLPDVFFNLIYVLLVLMAIFIPIANVLLITSIQMVVPPEKYGRIASLLMVFSSIASPIGMIASGYIADALAPVSGPMGGIGFLYLLSAMIGLFINIFSWIFSDWRKIGSEKDLKK